MQTKCNMWTAKQRVCLYSFLLILHFHLSHRFVWKRLPWELSHYRTHGKWEMISRNYVILLIFVCFEQHFWLVGWAMLLTPTWEWIFFRKFVTLEVLWSTISSPWTGYFSRYLFVAGYKYLARDNNMTAVHYLSSLYLTNECLKYRRTL